MASVLILSAVLESPPHPGTLPLSLLWQCGAVGHPSYHGPLFLSSLPDLGSTPLTWLLSFVLGLCFQG